MKKHCVFAILLATLLALCLPLSCLAKPPRRAIIYGSLFGVQDNNTTYAARITPVNNMVFGVYATTDLDTCTRVYLYFGLGEEIKTGFTLSLRLLSTEFQLATQNTGFTGILNIAENGSVSDMQSVASSTTISVADDVITWEVNGNFSGRTGIQVAIIFQNFVIGSNPMYFRMEELTVNSMTMEEVEVSQYAEQFQARLERLEDIEDAAYQQIDIHVNDIREYLQNTDGDHYFADFHYLFSQSTLLSTMCAVVALFGILGFILFGKKV